MGAKRDVSEAAKKRSEAIAGAGGEYQSAIDKANTAYQGAIDKANTDYQASQDKIVADTEEGFTQANQDFATIVQGYKDELDRAEKEDKKQQEIDQKTVAWTGATELAAAIANMVGVGSFGAANQQYHSFSQDWMRRADADAKLRQQRIDNIRERQRAMEQQGINLRLQGLNALNRARGDAASAAYKGAIESAGVGYKGALDTAGTAYKTANAVAESDFNGVQQAASIGLQEQAKNISAAAQRSSQELAEWKSGAKRDENGKLVADPASPYYTKNTGKGSVNFAYDATINGVNYKLLMNKETFERAIKDGNTELKQDIVKMLGVDSWEALAEDAAQKKDKKKKYLEYAPVINALNSGTPDQTGIIDRFIQDHRGELDNFNTHLLRVSSGAQDRGPAVQTSSASAQSTQAPVQPSNNPMPWGNPATQPHILQGETPASENKDERKVSEALEWLNS